MALAICMLVKNCVAEATIGEPEGPTDATGGEGVGEDVAVGAVVGIAVGAIVGVGVAAACGEPLSFVNWVAAKMPPPTRTSRSTTIPMISPVRLRAGGEGGGCGICGAKVPPAG